jgi:hypothetical protein
MAIEDGMAANLATESAQKFYEESGDGILDTWEEEYRADYTMMINAIRSEFRSAFFVVLALVSAVLSIGNLTGRLDPSLPFDLLTTLAFLGSALVGWATLVELGGDFTVWDGKAFPQLAHTVIFKAIFLPGIFIILLSILL